MTISEKISSIVTDINKGVYDKDCELKLALLAAIAGESILILGPPGVAKSMIARSIKNVFKDANSFEYLMSRFSTPDEVFGPVSIAKLKDSEQYERITEGYLPNADVVFLDEIWKAGPAIQNSLLTVLNEKIFRNGNREMHLPLKLLIAASNELPAQGEGLEALWDRFLIRIVSKSIRKEEDFYRMLLDDSDVAGNVRYPLSQEEYNDWQKGIDKVKVGDDVLKTITFIRQKLNDVLVDDSELRKSIYVSDRRWKKIVRLLKVEAYMRGHKEVELSDLYIIHHCLWNNPNEYIDVKDIVLEALAYPIEVRVNQLRQKLNDDLKAFHLRDAMEKVLYRDVDKKLKIYDNGYYYVKGHERGNTFIYMYDFLELSFEWTEAKSAMIFPAANEDNKLLIHNIGGVGAQVTDRSDIVGQTGCKLFRGEGCVFINGVRYDLEQCEDGEQATNILAEMKYSDTDYVNEFENVENEMAMLEKSFHDNIFIAQNEISASQTEIIKLRKMIERMKLDHMKLL